MALFRKQRNNLVMPESGQDDSAAAVQDILAQYQPQTTTPEPVPDYGFSNEDLDEQLDQVNAEIAALEETETAEETTPEYSLTSDYIEPDDNYVEPEVLPNQTDSDAEDVEELLQEVEETEEADLLDDLSSPETTAEELLEELDSEEPVATIEVEPAEVVPGPYTNYEIEIDLLQPSPLNEGISLDGIESLKESIKDIGLTNELVVAPTDDGYYEILSGERRFRALQQLQAEGDHTYDFVPCKVVDLDAIHIDVDDTLKRKLILASTNTEARKLTTSDQILLQQMLEEVWAARQAAGEDVGTQTDFIVEQTGMSPTTVQRNKKIDEGLIPELKEELLGSDEEPSKASLERIAAYDTEQQEELLEAIEEDITIDKEFLDTFEEETLEDDEPETLELPHDDDADTLVEFETAPYQELEQALAGFKEKFENAKPISKYNHDEIVDAFASATDLIEMATQYLK